MTKRFSKKIYLYLFIPFILILISFIFYNIKSNKLVTREEWAFKNYGQEINTIKGIKDIDINILPAWEITKGNKDIIVAVIDTGIDINLDLFKSNLHLNELDISDGSDNDNNEYIDDYYGWDFYNNDNSLYDDYAYDYHGTYIAANILKVAPNIKILPVKFLNSSYGSVDDSIKAIQYAIDRGAKIINCSWNFNEYNDELYNIIKNNPNVIFVSAAGNEHVNLDETQIYPTNYNLSNIISVIGITSSGDAYITSGYGKNIDIASPGENILVNLPENDTIFIDGTSIATSFVTGTLALMYSLDSSLSVETAKEILITSSTSLNSLKEKCKSEGILNVYESLKKVKYLSNN